MGAQKPVRIVIDTNVLVSAVLFGGSPGKLLEKCRQGDLKAFASEEIVTEILRVLAYPKFKLTENELQYILYREIFPVLDIVAVPIRDAVIPDDPSDDMFLHCAVAANAEAIISGDRHLLALGTFLGIPILGVSDFLKVSV